MTGFSSRQMAVALALVLLASGCDQKQEAGTGKAAKPGLQVADLVVGTGDTLRDGDYFTVHYRGWLYQDGRRGEIFEDTYQQPEPLTFRLGRGQVIPGWEDGLVGMRVGGKRRLVVPSEKGFGSQGTSRIPSDSILEFEIELLEIPRVASQILKPGSGSVAEEGDEVTINYTAWIAADGQKGQRFDSTSDRGQPFSFTLGAGQVLAGLDLGIIGMNLGETRLLSVPPQLAYGAQGMRRGNEILVPQAATLLFEVELLDILGK